MRNDNQSSVIANAYLKMLQDRFAPADEVVVETPEVAAEPEETTEEPKVEE